jgi:hypothetical protein
MESRPKKNSSHKDLNKESKDIDSLEEKLKIVRILHAQTKQQLSSSLYRLFYEDPVVRSLQTISQEEQNLNSQLKKEKDKLGLKNKSLKTLKQGKHSPLARSVMMRGYANQNGFYLKRDKLSPQIKKYCRLDLNMSSTPDKKNDPK